MPTLTRRRLLSWAAVTVPCTSALFGIDPNKLNLAITTDEVDPDLATAIDFVREFELDWVEIRNLDGKYNTSQPESVVRAARRMLDEAQLRTAILDTGFFKVAVPKTPTDLAKQWDLLERAFVRAEILGTDLIRMFAFTYRRGEQPDPANYPRIFELLAEASSRARARGFRLALENVGRSYVATAEDSARALAAVGDPALGLTWDPNNSAGSGDPDPFPSGYAKLDATRIFHVHLRDYRRTPEGGAEWCGVGQGEFDHVGQIRALLKDGYTGALSLETHFTIDGSKAKASRLSMTNLIERVGRV